MSSSCKACNKRFTSPAEGLWSKKRGRHEDLCGKCKHIAFVAFGEMVYDGFSVEYEKGVLLHTSDDGWRIADHLPEGTDTWVDLRNYEDSAIESLYEYVVNHDD